MFPFGTYDVSGMSKNPFYTDKNGQLEKFSGVIACQTLPNKLQSGYTKDKQPNFWLFNKLGKDVSW